jgi:6-pyruvoyltetrahydropterin/6-carboxytetrahydropterin synthase
LETSVEFTFEPPHPWPHGHSFKVVVYLTDEPTPHKLCDVEATALATKQQLDGGCLDAMAGPGMPGLDSIARWIWHRLDSELPGLDRVLVRRGIDGAGESCSYSGRPFHDAARSPGVLTRTSAPAASSSARLP